MKKLFLQMALFALCAQSVFLNAQAKEEANSYRVGFSTGWVNYLEPGYISFYGLMYGVDEVVQLSFLSKFDVRIESSAQFGNIQYDGSVKDTTTGQIAPLKAGAYDYLLVGRVIPEYNFYSSDKAEYFFKLGVGGRYLNDRVNSTSGYLREVAYVFLPLGGRMEYRYSESSIFGLDLEYDLFVFGKVKSHLSDTNPANPDVTNTQSSGAGIRIQLEYRLLLGSTWYGIKPYFQWWGIGSSDAAPYTTGLVLIEPQNSSSFAGVSLDMEL